MAYKNMSKGYDLFMKEFKTKRGEAIEPFLRANLKNFNPEIRAECKNILHQFNLLKWGVKKPEMTFDMEGRRTDRDRLKVLNP